MDKATYRQELTAKTIESVASALNGLGDDKFFELLNKGGELSIKSGTAPNGKACDVFAIWSSGSADFKFVDSCTFEARGESGAKKLPASQVANVLSMVK